jgi:hypothetical protein
MTILLTRKTKQTNYSAPLNLNAAQRLKSAAADSLELSNRTSQLSAAFELLACVKGATWQYD